MTDETESAWKWWITEGDCVSVMNAMRPESLDAIVIDPPYEIAFMGKGWDNAGVAFDPETWKAALRVLKPGGHLLAFGATRTYHRMTVAIEDAGFEIRDSIMWLYGTGFPKSHDVSKAIDKQLGAEREETGREPRKGRSSGILGKETEIEVVRSNPGSVEPQRFQGWGTALKPAHEPIVVARKPLEGTVAANVLKHGTGGMNIDGCRVALADGEDVEKLNARSGGIRGFATKFVGGDATAHGRCPPTDLSGGRWPANVILDESRAAELDEQSGYLHGSGNKSDTGSGADREYDASSYQIAYAVRANRDYGSQGGGASRFFYVAKPSKKERDFGLDDLPEVETAAMQGNLVSGQPLAGNGTPITTPKRRNTHPTVKPVQLMRYLVRLVTPPDGIVLDPFCGSGTTLMAAVQEGIRCVGIEQSHEYVELATKRVTACLPEPRVVEDAT